MYLLSNNRMQCYFKLKRQPDIDKLAKIFGKHNALALNNLIDVGLVLNFN